VIEIQKKNFNCGRLRPVMRPGTKVPPGHMGVS
jgi:hypothetical protein